jgi:DnaK suppressor protein
MNGVCSRSRPATLHPTGDAVDAPVRNAETTPLSFPHSRSRGGIDAVSLGRPSRRKPRRPRSKGREANRPAYALPAEFVEAARRELSEQRAFRINQLIQLDVTRPEAAADTVWKEVHAKLSAGAITVLADIESALRRIEHGTYGCCQRCGEPVSLGRLTALPMAPMCGPCQCIEEVERADPGVAILEQADPSRPTPRVTPQ